MEKYLKEALEEYERKIESGIPFYMDASVLMDIGEYYEKKGMQYEAERLMRFAEKLHPENEEVMIVKAYRLKARGKWDEALRIIVSIPDQQSRDVKLFIMELAVAEGIPNKAERTMYEQLPETMSLEDYDWFLDLSEMFLDYGFAQRALRLLEQIPDNYSQRRRVDELIAEVYYQMQDYEKSIEALNRLIDADPYDDVSWAQMADIQQKWNKLEDCITSCDYALAINPDSRQAMNLKLFATFGLDRFDEGMKLYDEFATRLPDDYSIRMYAGEQYLAQGEYHEALLYLRTALRLCPLDNSDHPRITSGIAFAMAHKGNTEQPEELMLSLTLSGNEPATLYHHVAELYFDCNNPEKAISMLEKMIAVKTSGQKELMQAVQMLFTNKCFVPATRLWVKLAQIDFSVLSAEAYIYIAFAMHRLKQPQLYIRCLHLGITHKPFLIKNIFGGIYGTDDLEEIRKKAEDEAVGWTEQM